MNTQARACRSSTATFAQARRAPLRTHLNGTQPTQHPEGAGASAPGKHSAHLLALVAVALALAILQAPHNSGLSGVHLAAILLDLKRACVLQRLVEVNVLGHTGHAVERCVLAVVFEVLPVLLQAPDHSCVALQRARLAGRPLQPER